MFRGIQGLAEEYTTEGIPHRAGTQDCEARIPNPGLSYLGMFVGSRCQVPRWRLFIQASMLGVYKAPGHSGASGCQSQGPRLTGLHGHRRLMFLQFVQHTPDRRGCCSECGSHVSGKPAAVNISQQIVPLGACCCMAPESMLIKDRFGSMMCMFTMCLIEHRLPGHSHRLATACACALLRFEPASVQHAQI